MRTSRAGHTLSSRNLLLYLGRHAGDGRPQGGVKGFQAPGVCERHGRPQAGERVPGVPFMWMELLR